MAQEGRGMTRDQAMDADLAAMARHPRATVMVRGMVPDTVLVPAPPCPTMGGARLRAIEALGSLE